MQKRSNFVAYFLVFIILCAVLFFAAQTPLLSPVTGFLQGVLAPVSGTAYNLFSKITNFNSTSQVNLLKKRNQELTQKLVDQTKLISDNSALRDQFATSNPKSADLIPAQIVGAPGFIPGISSPETFIVDKGTSDGVSVGNAVVYQNNLIGVVSKTSAFVSSVTLITNSSFSFTAKTLETNALGVAKGQGGGEIILDNVLLSDNLQKDDTVITNGDVNQNSQGLIPGLVVGKIISVSKNPSDLFQKAEIKSSLDFTKLNKVFIIASDK